MGKWMDLAAELEAAAGTEDDRDERDKSPPNVPIVPNVPANVPPDLRRGLVALKSMAAPRIVRSEEWPEVMSDALRLASDGWATKALALGWEPLDLFGAVVDRDGYNFDPGLAVWLRGRPVLAIASTYASVSDGTGRAYFNRCLRRATTLLWDVGRNPIA